MGIQIVRQGNKFLSLSVRSARSTSRYAFSTCRTVTFLRAEVDSLLFHSGSEYVTVSDSSLQERDDHCRRGNEERKQRYPSEQEHRRERSGDRDRHRDHSDRRKNPNERPGVRGHERERDVQNIREQQAEREFYNERRREHRQNNEGSGVDQNPELGQSDNKPKEKASVNKEKPSFELSGALLEDTNTFRGVVIKYSEPPEARIPKKRWRLYPFKNDEFLPVMYIHRQSAYLLGRHRRIADIPIDHPSCSKQHAVFQYR